MTEGLLKNVELDKICRVCLTSKNDMRPLHGELIAAMLLEIAKITLENIDGWPDKICIQCIHQISRCHAFKSKVEKLDAQLKEYIKGLTVIVEEIPKEPQPPRTITQTIEVHGGEMTAGPFLQQPMYLPASSQIFNTSQAQFLSDETISLIDGQQVTHASPTRLITQLIQNRDNTLQVIPQAPGQLLQIQSGDSLVPLIMPTTESTMMQEFKNDSEDKITSDSIQIDNSLLTQSDDCEEESESETEEKQLLAEFMCNQTSTKNNVHICNLCQKEFRNVKWLQSHMKSHSNWIKANCKKLPECEVCGKTFKGPGMLKMHMKVHFPKVNSCSICKKEFKSKSILYRHRQSHFERTHLCHICTKTFATNYQLNSHLVRHRGEKTFKCLYCEKSYYNASDLKCHLQSHLGMKLRKNTAQEFTVQTLE